MSRRDRVARMLAERDVHSPVFCDGLDEALLGIAERGERAPVPLYDRARAVALYAAARGLARDAADEAFDAEMRGFWAGERTPAFATFVADDEPAECEDEALGVR